MSDCDLGKAKNGLEIRTKGDGELKTEALRTDLASPMSPPSALDERLESERFDKVTDFMKNVVEKHKDLHKQYFKGDAVVDQVFAQTMRESKCLCKVLLHLPANADEEDIATRVEHANSLLTMPLLQKRNRFDIIVDRVSIPGHDISESVYVQGEEEEEEEGTEGAGAKPELTGEPEESNENLLTGLCKERPLQYSKILFNGWHVNISKETFDILAYGDYENMLPEKEYSNIHSLGIRGDIIGRALARASIVITCANEELHHSRNKEREKRKLESEHRANQFCIGIDLSLAKDLESFREAVVFRELHIRFSKEISKAVVITSNTESVVEVKFATPASPTALEKMVAKVSEKNLARLRKMYNSRMKRVMFKEKFDYWRALRSSSGTTQRLLLKLFDTCLNGGDDFVFEGARSLAEQYRRQYKDSTIPSVAQKLMQWQASASLSTGFMSGFGGFMTMAVTIPAGLLAAWTTSARLAFAIAHLYGHDIYSPSVCSAVLYALTGSGKKSDEGENSLTAEEDLQMRLRACALVRKGTQLPETQDLVPSTVASGDSDKQTENQEVEEESSDANKALEVSISSKEFATMYETLYDLLQVKRDATPEEIRSSFRKLALRCHPDKIQSGNPEQLERAKERFQVIVAAYEILSDETARRRYDADIDKGSWDWSKLGWNKGMARAKEAFQRYCDKDHHDVSRHVATRAMTQVTVNVVEEIASKGAMRSFAAAELRTSIVAGEKLAAQATSQSASKMIPLVGALISGAIDCATTASVGRCANRVFNCLD